MLRPADFELEKCILASSDRELHVARREKAGRPVLLEIFKAGSDESRIIRAGREVELLNRLAGSGVPRVSEVIDDLPDPVLVLEHRPGRTLRDVVAAGPLRSADLVHLGRSLAETLARIHGERLLVLGLDPARIWLDDEGGEVRILDFGSVRALGARSEDPAQGRTALPKLEALPFISPEQTGRMGRGVDSRSDLYALGACLYFAATGRPPFEGDDALGLVHAHLARPFVSPVELRPDLPPTLSRIISRLLQKSPESRYQVAAAVQTDFEECRGQLERTGAIADDLVLGTADAPYRPLFSKVLYGRAHEEAELREAFAEAREGTANAVLLSGVAGAGKSSLVDGLRQRVTRAGGYLAQGKFDLYRVDLPYSGVAAALGNVVHQLLTESDERLAAWDEKLRSALGGVASALVGVVPDIELVLRGLSPAQPVAPAQALARLSLAVERFIAAMAAPEHPLVLFIDDLQWADAASREVLKSLLTRPEPRAFVFIGAYRSEEVRGIHPLAKWLEDVASGPLHVRPLALAPLTTDAAAEMLADALDRTATETRDLAAQIARKTANNPLLIQQFVSHLSDLGLITFAPGVGWTWDETQIAAAGVVDDAVKLLSERISRLPEGAAHMLEIAACVGDAFGAERIASLADASADEVDRALFALSDEGLIAPASEGFRFVHDRIREAAQQRIAGPRAADLHFAIARQLLEETPSGKLSERVFEIADHLSPVLDRAIAQDRERVLEIHALAGERAVRAGAARTAMRYLAVAMQILAEGEGDAGLPFIVDVYLNAADAACQLAEYEAAARCLGPLQGRALPPLLRARVGAKWIQLVIMGSDWTRGSQALPRVIEMLREYGDVHWPEVPSMTLSRIVVRYTDWLLRGPLDESVFQPAQGDPSSWLPELILLSAAAPVLQARASRSTCLTAALGLRCYLRHGYVGSPALSLAGYAAYRRTVVGHTRGLERYVDAALAWADRTHDATFAARSRFVVYAFAQPWFGPRDVAVDQLESACHELRELGDLEFTLYAASQRANYVALGGAPLERIEADLRGVGDRSGRQALEAYEVFAETCAYLRRALPDDAAIAARCQQVERLFDAVPSSRMSCWPFWILVLSLLGRYDLAHQISERFALWAFEAAATSAQLADYVLLRGIAAGEMASRERPRRRARRRVLRKSIRTLRLWARDSAYFAHMVQALEAENARLHGRAAEAIRRYRSAAESALRIGSLHHAAWFHERGALLLASARREVDAGLEMRRAVRLFDEWGATAKAEALRAALDPSPVGD